MFTFNNFKNFLKNLDVSPGEGRNPDASQVIQIYSFLFKTSSEHQLCARHCGVLGTKMNKTLFSPGAHGKRNIFLKNQKYKIGVWFATKNMLKFWFSSYWSKYYILEMWYNMENE